MVGRLLVTSVNGSITAIILILDFGSRNVSSSLTHLPIFVFLSVITILEYSNNNNSVVFHNL